MDSRLEQISYEIKRIAHTPDVNRQTLMSGTVVSVTGMTASIALTADGDGSGNVVVNNDALLNVTIDNMGGVYLIPSVNADCLVGWVDDHWEVLKASAYDKIVIQAETAVQFNDGSLGALVVLSKLQDNLKAIHDYIFNTLQPAIEQALTAVGEGAGQAAQPGRRVLAGQWRGRI